MRLSRLLLMAVLSLSGVGCQMPFHQAHEPTANLSRLQGKLSWAQGQWQFANCRDGHPVHLGNTAALEDAKTLLNGQDGTLLADLTGVLAADGSYTPTRFLRLEAQNTRCDEAAARRVQLHAFGSSPNWDIQVTHKGLVLQQPGQAPLALPYLEEHLPSNALKISSQANGRQLDLWVAQQRCVDNAHHGLYGFSAELRWDNQVLRGCAYPGPL